MTLGSEESIRIIQVLLQAEKFHPHFPLKPTTSGLGLSVNAYRSNPKVETKPNNPKGFVFSNFSTAWTTAVFLCKFHLSTARASGEERSKVLRLETKTQHRCSKRSNAVLLPAILCSPMHWSSSFCASPEGWRLDFLFSSSRLQNKVMSQPGLKSFSAPLEPASDFSDLF